MRGKSGYVPFWPGGLDNVIVEDEDNQESVRGLRTIPPGFARGLRLAGEEGDDETLTALAGISGSKCKQETEEVGLFYFSPPRRLLN